VHHRDDEKLIREIDAEHARLAAGHHRLLRLVAEVDRRETWRDVGARDTAHWLSIRYGVSQWKARRWIAAAHALESLPRVSEALVSGDLHVDKVVELTRFAAPETESRLVLWASGVSCGAIRRRADVVARRSSEDAEEVERARSLSWWTFDEGRRFGLEGELPSADGAIVARMLDRLAASLPVMPDEHGAPHVDARRADALVALCSGQAAEGPDRDRATLVVHAVVDPRTGDLSQGQIEDGSAISAGTARRLACNARIQAMIEDETGMPVRLGRITREPPPWMLRQLRYRDGECRFPGCGSRRFTQAHHIVWWEHGGRTDLDNLILICTFHHRLVHEYGWRVQRDPDGSTSWIRRDGRRYRAGPSPPEERVAS
jgi:hypothetical protein